MKISARLSGVAASVLVALSIGLTPAQASSVGTSPEVTISLPSSTDSNFNAIATWNPVDQSGCLYDAENVHAAPTSDSPWAIPGNCTNWTPKVGTPPGIYTLTWNAGNSKALVVMSSAPNNSRPSASTVVIVPDYTWQAYDLLKNGNFYFYRVGDKVIDFSTRKLNLLRPMNFSRVGDPKNYPASPELFPFANPLEFLSKTHVKFEVIAQSALDSYQYNLSNFRTILLYGHDEYWTEGIKKKIENAVADGTNLVNLSGNTAYRKLVRNAEVIGFTNPSAGHQSTSKWGDLPGDTTSVKLLGSEYLGEPFSKRGKVPPRITKKLMTQLHRDGLPPSITSRIVIGVLKGILVRNSSDPIFEGTQLKDGDFIGTSSNLMSIEVDGIPLTSRGTLEPSFASKFGSTPVSFSGEAWLNARVSPDGPSWRAGQLIQTTFGKGKVFTAGPIGWTTSLISGDRQVEKITSNVLRLFG